MASRYLRASGNWNGRVWAATSGGAAGSASTPTINDEVTIGANFTVTLSANAAVATISHTNGHIRFAGYKLTVDANLTSSGTTARSIDFQGGTLEFTGGGLPQLTLSGSNLTWASSDGLITFNQGWSIGSSSVHFATGNKTFGDVIINMGANTSSSTTFNITGSPTFRSLIIQSKNNVAHTVRFDDGAYVRVEKAIYIGSSPSNRLTIDGQSSESSIFSTQDYGTTLTGTFYAQNINLKNWDLSEYVSSPDEAELNLYAGTGSTSSNLSGGSLILQDPPKISTLVDPLTLPPRVGDQPPTSPPTWNDNWTADGTVTQVTIGKEGGGYVLGNYSLLMSTGTYDLTDSELVFEVPPQSPSGNSFFGAFALADKWSHGTNHEDVAFYSERYDAGFAIYEILGVSLYRQSNGGNDVGPFPYPNDESFYIRIKESTGVVMLSLSADGQNWQPIATSSPLSEIDRLLIRSVRVKGASYGTWAVGSINPIFGPQVPVASFSADVTSGRAPLTVHFTDASSGIPSAWQWNFGDNTFSSQRNPTKTYTQPGVYNVSLRASNSLGSHTVIRNYYITVEATVVTLGSVPSSVAFSSGHVITPGAVTISGGDTRSSVAFGEGYTTVVNASGGSATSAHDFGDYTVITGNFSTVGYGGIPSSVAFGTDWTAIRVGVIVSGGSAHDGPTFGDYTVLPGPVNVSGYGGASASPEVATGWEITQGDPPPPPPTDWSVIGKEDKKAFVYHVYTSAGEYAGIWTDVEDEPEFTQHVNTPGTTMTVQLARSADNTREVRTRRITTTGSQRVTQHGTRRVSVGETPNTIGPGTDVEINYSVDVYAHYGEFRTRITRANRVRVTTDGHIRVASRGAPQGVRIFSGFILDYDSEYAADNAGVTVTLASHGYELSHQLIKDGNKTTVRYPSQPIETTAKAILDTNPGRMRYSTGSIAPTEVSVPATFQLNTKLEGIQHLVEQADADWYWFGHVGENNVYIRPTSTEPDHIFIKGKHIKSLRLKRSIENLVNEVYFVGGEVVEGDPTSVLFRRYVNPTSMSTWRTGLHRKTDRRYKLTTSTQRYADKLLAENGDPAFTTPLVISSARYDIEMIKLGQTVAFRNFGNFIDEVVLQIVSMSYTPTAITVQLGTMLERQVETLSKVEASLDNEQYENIPDEPS